MGFHAFSSTAGGIFAPLRNPGMDTLEATVDSTLSYVDCVWDGGMVSVSSTADCGNFLRVEVIWEEAVE